MDGVSLTSVAHPKTPWYRRLWFWLRRPRLSPGSLEEVEITIREPNLFVTQQQARILNRLSTLRPYMPIKLEPGDLEACNAAMRLEQAEDELAHALLNKARSFMSDTAPKVTLEHIEACIAWEYYVTGAEAFRNTTAVIGPAYKEHQQSDITPLARLTFCVLILRNGFTVTGESACVLLENFDAELGRKIARQNAIDKIWVLEGYLLKERLHRDAINRSSSGSGFGDS